MLLVCFPGLPLSCRVGQKYLVSDSGVPHSVQKCRERDRLGEEIRVGILREKDEESEITNRKRDGK